MVGGEDERERERDEGGRGWSWEVRDVLEHMRENFVVLEDEESVSFCLEYRL